MGSNVVGNTIQNLAYYLIVSLGGAWVVEKILGPSGEIPGFSAFQVCVLQGNFLRALIIAACLYLVYFVAAGFVSYTGNNGKLVVGLIGLYLLGSLAYDLIQETGSGGLIKNVSTGFLYLVIMLDNVVQIIATFHGLKSELRS